jgi:hypothetical protein
MLGATIDNAIQYNIIKRKETKRRKKNNEIKRGFSINTDCA